MLLVTTVEAYLKDVRIFEAKINPAIMESSDQSVTYGEVVRSLSINDLAEELQSGWARNFVDDGGPTRWIDKLTRMGARGFDSEISKKMETLLRDLIRLNSHFSFVRLSYHALASKTDVKELAQPTIFYWWDPMKETDEHISRVANDLVANRKNEFWAETLSSKSNPGFFLHYLQDMFSHRDFKSFVGHAGYNRVDFLASDRSKAHDMTAETLKYLYFFRETVLKNKSGVKNPDELRIEDFLQV